MFNPCYIGKILGTGYSKLFIVHHILKVAELYYYLLTTMNKLKKHKTEDIFTEINSLRLIALCIIIGIMYMSLSQYSNSYIYSTLPIRIALASVFLLSIIATFISDKVKKNFATILFALGFPLIISFIVYIYHFRFEPTRAFGLVVMIATYGFIFNSKRFLLLNLLFHTSLLLFCFYKTEFPLVDAKIYIPFIFFTFTIFYFLTSSKIDNINAISEKEALMSALFHNSPEAYLLYDYSTGYILGCNPRMISLLGANPSDTFARMPAAEMLFMETILPKIPTIINHLNEKHTTWNGEVIIKSHKPYMLTVDLAVNHLTYMNSLLTMRFVDITHRRTMEDALQMMRFSIDQASEMVFWLDEKGSIVYANGAAHRFLKYDNNTLLNKNIAEIDFEFCQKAKTNSNNSNFNAYDFIKNEAVYTARTGEKIPVDIGKNLLQYADKKIICLFARDMTIRKESEMAMHNYAEKLKSSNEELEQFAYVVSHDLQAPLRMVISYLQLLERRLGNNDIDEDTKEYIDFAVSGSKRMSEMIQAILQYSRTNRQDLNLEEFAPNEALDIALNNLSVLASEARADIQFAPMPPICADRFKLTQLFQNLVGNALKYRKPNSPAIVKIFFADNPDEWQFGIADNGIGISSEYHDKIFKIFRRLHTYPEYEGTGIGLSICERIVRQHNGKIWLESEPDKGTTFYFTISKKITT